MYSVAAGVTLVETMIEVGLRIFTSQAVSHLSIVMFSSDRFQRSRS
jgi:hypothetical protein